MNSIILELKDHFFVNDSKNILYVNELDISPRQEKWFAYYSDCDENGRPIERNKVVFKDAELPIKIPPNKWFKAEAPKEAVVTMFAAREE